MKKGLSILTFLMILMVFQSPTYAHKLLLEPLEEGLIEVKYEDGKVPSQMQMTVYDASGEEVAKGFLEADGSFRYDSKVAAKIVADDGMGHLLTWEVGSKGVSSGGWGKYLKMAGVILVFIGVAFWSMKAGKLKKRTHE